VGFLKRNFQPASREGISKVEDAFKCSQETRPGEEKMRNKINKLLLGCKSFVSPIRLRILLRRFAMNFENLRFLLQWRIGFDFEQLHVNEVLDMVAQPN
jgi:hypothetical protein